MDTTQRMRRILQASRVEKLLDACVSRGDSVPEGSYRIRDPKVLTDEMREILNRATEHGQVWSCWADGLHAWLFTCELSLHRSCEWGTPVLHVDRYGEEGRLTDSGSWMSDWRGKWSRCAD